LEKLTLFSNQAKELLLAMLSLEVRGGVFMQNPLTIERSHDSSEQYKAEVSKTSVDTHEL
jgi:hypothetical protein